MGKKSYNGWGGPDVRLVPPPENPAPHRATKNRKKWCKGKVGREHDWEFIIPTTGWLAGRPCRRWKFIRPNPRYSNWNCNHAWVCKKCGKIDYNKHGQPCPDFVPEE